MNPKPYPEYKDSGVEWIGKIPKDWNVGKLKSVAQISKDKLNHKPINSPYIGLEHIESWSGVLKYNKIEVVESSVNIFKKGDILLGKLRPYLAKVVEAPFDGVSSTEIVILDVHDNLNNRFIFYQVLSQGFINEINSLTYGVKMPRVSPEQIGNVSITIPNFNEKKFISNFLDKKTSKIDKTIQKDTKLIELLKEKRVAIIHHAVSKGLDPDVKMKDSGVEWIGDIPNHWKLTKLKYFISLSSGEYINIEDMIIEGKYEVFGGNGVLGHANKYNISDKSIIIGRVGAKCGNVRFVEGKKWVSDNALILKTDQNYNYTSYLLTTMNLNDMANQNAQPLLTSTQIKNKIGVLPSKKEQFNISTYLDKESLKIDETIYKIQNKINLLEEYKKSLIHHVITGKVDVRGVTH